MKILLITAPVVSKTLRPVGLAYISSFIKSRRDYTVKTINLSNEIYVENDQEVSFWCKQENFQQLFSENKELFNEWVDRIFEYDPDIIGFSVWNSARLASIRLADMIKDRDPGRLIVFGGYDCSLFGDDYIKESPVDIVVKGEGEETFLEICDIYASSKTVKFCKGAIIKNGSEITDCGPRPAIEELDTIPFPDYSDYKNLNGRIPLCFNRGCVYRCSYCHIREHVKNYRHRSAENIFREIIFRLENTPGIELFDIGDSNALQSPAVCSGLCDMIIAAGLKISIEIWSAINPGIDYELLKKMNSAGFTNIGYGIELGTERLMKSMGKWYTVDDAERLIRDTYRAGIDFSTNVLIGFPGETEEDFNITLNFLKRNSKYIRMVPQVHEFHIFPRSHISENPEKYGVDTRDCGDITGWVNKEAKDRLLRIYDLLKQIGIAGSYAKE